MRRHSGTNNIVPGWTFMDSWKLEFRPGVKESGIATTQQPNNSRNDRSVFYFFSSLKVIDHIYLIYINHGALKKPWLTVLERWMQKLIQNINTHSDQRTCKWKSTLRWWMPSLPKNKTTKGIIHGDFNTNYNCEIASVPDNRALFPNRDDKCQSMEREKIKRANVATSKNFLISVPGIYCTSSLQFK